MRTPVVIFILIVCFFMIGACTTTQGAGANNGETTVTRPNDGDGQAVASEMRSYMENARKKLDEMAIAEAVRMYVAALAASREQHNPSQEVRDLAATVQTELTRLETGFLMQAGGEWLDENENQVASSTYTVGKGDALNPTIMLWYNIGGSRIAVSAAPVLFEFVKGSGLITGFTATNEYGEASVPLGRIDNPTQETVVRASLTFTVKGFTYAFTQTKVEFVWLPPSKRATILVLERGPDYTAEDPTVFNPVYDTLKKMEFDFIPYNGRLLGDNFMNVFGGELKSIKGLSVGQNVPYLAVVLNDCYSVRKLPEYKSVYVGEGKATLRIIRITDGKILFEAVGYADRAHDTHGQGNSPATTMRNVFIRAANGLVKVLDQEKKDINRALGIN
jgi:hypothetical protein